MVKSFSLLITMFLYWAVFIPVRGLHSAASFYISGDVDAIYSISFAQRPGSYNKYQERSNHEG